MSYQINNVIHTYMYIYRMCTYNVHCTYFVFLSLYLSQVQIQNVGTQCNFSLFCGPGIKPKESIKPHNRLVQMWRMIVILAVLSAWTVYNEQKQKISELNQKISELNQKMSEQDQKIIELNQTTSEQGQKIIELNQTMSEQGQKIIELNQTMSEQGQKITELSQKMSEQGQTITEQNQNITELSRNMSEWGKKITELQQQLVQEEEWRGAVARISEVEDRMMQMKEQWDTFQATKASQSELTTNVSMLSDTKVHMTDFNSLSSDIFDLRETVSTKADNDTVLGLMEDTHRVLEYISHQSQNLTKQIDHINITKADQHDVDQLTEKVTSLSTTTTMTEKRLAALNEIIQASIKSKGDLFSIGIQLVWSTSKIFLL